MKTAGIICEYNPFHLGHLRQLTLTRELLGADTAIVCIMSGNYVQRGEPALFSKALRARAAIACGADLVLELPITRVLQSAEGFARGGVEILHRLGLVDFLVFGAECGDGAALQQLAAAMEAPDFTQALRTGLSAGMSYAAARQAALGEAGVLLTQPNNILGVEYCRALLYLNSAISPVAIQRTGSYHASLPDAQAPSATAVRSLYPDGPWADFVPPEAAALFRDAPWYGQAFGERAMLARLRGLSPEDWEICAHGSEGLWSKVRRAVRSKATVEEILEASKSKRYPRTRIQRLLLCAYLGLSAEDLRRPIPYARILGFSPQGQTLIRQAKKLGTLPLLQPGQKPIDPAYYELEIRAADLYTLFAAPGQPCPAGSEQSLRLF